ncbi:MAG: hypothetical protein ACLU38_07085 [Dysosmobacter sp.]
MCHSKKYPGIHCPGRFAMVCCENDVQFMGLVTKDMDLNKYEEPGLSEVEARMALKPLRLRRQGSGNAHHLHPSPVKNPPTRS